VAAVPVVVAVMSEGGSNVMVPTTLKYGVVLVCGVLALASLAAMADEKKNDKPALSGTWGKKDGELRIEFADKGVMKVVPHSDSAVLTIVCDYTIEKEELVKAKVTALEGKEEATKKVQEHLPVGFQFTFKWKVNGAAARLDDIMGDDVAMLKSHLEGDFEQKK
jgi:hypothetical protein